jgi:indole-3-glycerol phosphate synthase
MSDILFNICKRRELHVDARRALYPLDEIKHVLKHSADKPRGFIDALKAKSEKGQPALIAEIKKASPSAGLIREDFNPESLAKIYEDSGAACLSVLTEIDYFQGADEYLREARNACALPVLRKDFTIDEYMIYESRLIGADCVLLIVAALSDAQLFAFHELSLSLGMDVLVEVHSKEELDRALKIPDLQLLGVNNRDLKTLHVDVQTSHDLFKSMPDDLFLVSESGLSDSETVFSLFNAGYEGFLIGEHFMRQDDVGQAVCSLLSPPKAA